MAEIDIAVGNANFEDSGQWNDLTTAHDQLFAPPDGPSYATRRGDQGWTSQQLPVAIEIGKVYTVTVWARSANTRALNTTASVQLRAGSEHVLASVETFVSPSSLQGAAASTPNDDGANVWLESGYRMEAADYIMWQPINADPIAGAWTRGERLDGMAHAPAMTPQGLRALFSTFYHDECPGNRCLSRIDKRDLRNRGPNSTLVPPTGADLAGPVYETVLSHAGDGVWVIDAHVYYDADTQRLWMTWGGWQIRITELDPATGLILDPATRTTPPSTEFTSHGVGVHTRILEFSAGAPRGWQGDAFATVGYQEGPSLFKHDGFWYACASYGDMDESYTIRCCRAPFVEAASDTGARGPYVDKLGRECTRFDDEASTFGASMLLGDDGDQLCPGHPHAWTESNGVSYLGYDYRGTEVDPQSGDALDLMGIRRLSFHLGWPTIWTPLEVEYRATSSYSASQPLTIAFRNAGDATSTALYDGFRLSINTGEHGSPSPHPRARPTPTPSSPPYTLPLRPNPRPSSSPQPPPLQYQPPLPRVVPSPSLPLPLTPSDAAQFVAGHSNVRYSLVGAIVWITLAMCWLFLSTIARCKRQHGASTAKLVRSKQPSSRERRKATSSGVRFESLGDDDDPSQATEAKTKELQQECMELEAN